MSQENNEATTIAKKRLEGKVAIVTGGARGIGEATVRLFSLHGAKVVIADVEDSVGQELASSFSPPLDVTYIHCDVSHEPDVERLVASTLAKHGRLDVLFNNAGYGGDPRNKVHKSVTALDSEEFDRVMRVNVLGTALGMKHAAKAMIPQRSGCILSTASVAGVAGGLGPHAYTASKHAVVGLTKNAASELGGYGVRVNCISPFAVATAMFVDAWKGECGGGRGNPREEDVREAEERARSVGDLKGVTLRAGDVAEAALYLASDEAKYVSGHNLVVDGGVTSARNCLGLWGH